MQYRFVRVIECTHLVWSDLGRTDGPCGRAYIYSIIVWRTVHDVNDNGHYVTLFCSCFNLVAAYAMEEFSAGRHRYDRSTCDGVTTFRLLQPPAWCNRGGISSGRRF